MKMNQKEMILQTIRQEHDTLFKNEECPDHIYSDYLEYCSTGQYPYLSSVNEFIVKKHGLSLSENEKENLQSTIYFCSHKSRKELERVYSDERLKEGWSFLSKDILASAVQQKRKVLLHIRTSGILGGTQKDVVCNVTRDEKNDNYWLFPPRCSRRGYTFWGLMNGDNEQFVKII